MIPTRPASRTLATALGDALAAEWTKARTLASTGWLLLAAVVLTVAVSAAVAAAVTCPAGNCAEDPAKISLTGIYLGQAVVAILAVLMISSEYSTGMIRLTLAAMPRRTTVLAAKAAILTGLGLAAGAVAVLASVLAVWTAHGPIGRLRRPVVAWMASPAVIGPICCRCRASCEPPRAAPTIGNR